MRHRGWFAAAFCAVLLLAGCGGEPRPSLLTGRACLAHLASHDVDYRPIGSFHAPESHCMVDTAVRVTRVDAGFNHPVTMSCTLASRLDDFEREVVQPLARS